MRYILDKIEAFTKCGPVLFALVLVVLSNSARRGGIAGCAKPARRHGGAAGNHR